MDDTDIRSDLALLRQRNAVLEARNDELMARLDRLEEREVDEVVGPVSRRGLLAKAAVIVAGAVVGGVALAEPAAAYTVVPLNNGEDNSSPTQTKFSYSVAHTSSTDGITTPFLSTGAAMVLVDNGSPGAVSTSIGLDARGNNLGLRSIAYNSDGIAVDGYSEGPDAVGGRFFGGNRAVVAIGNVIGVSTRAPVPLFFAGGHGTAGIPTSAASLGSFAMDPGGNLYFCVGTGTPGLFRKLAGPGSAGTLHLLPQPKRVFDSRADQPPQPPAGGGPKGILVSGTSVAIDCKANGSGVPADAAGVAFNLTITGTVLSGFLTTWGAGAQPGTSSINWTSAGADVANGVTIACDAGALIHVAAGGGGSTHFIVDVTGYYR
ncbi:MAG: hypothetical protein JWN39_2383 [Ilumatobacteraceae bacterium]|nr:hypothetical protein [Ilumatobacteraceae bacterium]